MDSRLFCILALALGPGVCGFWYKERIGLEHKSTVYVPYRYGADGAPDDFRYAAFVAPYVAVDKEQHIAYTVGDNFVHVVDFSDPNNAALVANQEVVPRWSSSLTDITFCKDWVAVCANNLGRVLIFSKYDPLVSPSMRLLHDIRVGVRPQSAEFTSDCSKLLVAIEGSWELGLVDTVVDPEGGVTVLDFGSAGPREGATFSNTFKDFTQFNAQAADYIARGVRKTYNGQLSGVPTDFSQDMEPESIAISPCEEYAYITLQENNAVAVLNINTLEWVDIYPLGTKSFEQGNKFGNKLDATDRDDGINIAHWPLHGLFQPDGAAVLTWKGRSYLVTANEGSDRHYNNYPDSFDEDVNGDDAIDELSPSVSQSVRDMLADRTKLGDLQISLVDGLDAQGLIVNLTTFGGRSISLFSTDDFSLVDDTGSEIARAFAMKFPFAFNADSGSEFGTTTSTFDRRSEHHGCEPESITIGSFGIKKLVFVGLENPGFIAVYSVEPSYTWPFYLPRLQLQSIYYGGGPNNTKTWGERWEERSSHALDVDDLTFISSRDSPTPYPMLVATGSHTGTLSFFEVKRGRNF